MATLYATNSITNVALTAQATAPVYKPNGGGTVACMMGHYELAANPTAADVIRFGKIPKGAVIVGGYLRGDDIDTGTETLDIDVGWEANGTETADTDGFGNMGVLNGATVTNVIPVASIFRNLQGVLNSDGRVAFSAETWVSAVVNTAASAGGTGTLSVQLLYVVP